MSIDATAARPPESRRQPPPILAAPIPDAPPTAMAASTVFLDAGIVPIVFAGNEKSKHFFEKNEQLCARLGRPLELTPLTRTEPRDRTLFKTFCRDLDAALVNNGVVRSISGLSDTVPLSGLMAASGGRVGRVVRIVEAAMEHAVSRDADRVELYDLSHAVQTFAMPQRYINKNPFAK
ncbi:hypothetical protein E5673_14785 [Sphingomonas sp. PAMC26645]|uniref:hypothetical protein n=1 Tax=Sphingomonas sp. PAMC26645 TaxID=2565555 RepID=UPI00109D92C2|nr:hypothetical protein [Sphingomonas sp. PAMC26645]QCB43335.1 hypothetical protein E5673_14785 [Sphingomonas sp. PAMC26645]